MINSETKRFEDDNCLTIKYVKLSDLQTSIIDKNKLNILLMNY